MLFSLGLSLRWDTIDVSRLPTLFPIVILQMFISPLIVWAVAQGVGLDGMIFMGTVMEAAMPSMVIGIVLCDRYGLDTGLYAAAVTLFCPPSPHPAQEDKVPRSPYIPFFCCPTDLSSR